MKITVHCEGTPTEIARQLIEAAQPFGGTATAAKVSKKAAPKTEDDDLSEDEFNLGDEDGLNEEEATGESEELEAEESGEDEGGLTLDGDVIPAVQKHLVKLKKKAKGDSKAAHAEIKKILKKFGATKVQEVKEKHWPALLEAVA